MFNIKMMKRLQNKISESRITLPVVAIYGLAIWMASGLTAERIWIPFAAFVVSVLLMVELNNSNALIRVYSRMVSCSFIVMYVMAAPLFNAEGQEPNIRYSLAGMCVAASLLLLFRSYQNRTDTGSVFYSFLCIGLASVASVHILYYVPLLWLMMIFYVHSISWRTFFASVMGLALPYWFASLYFIYTEDPVTPVEHFARLADVWQPLAVPQFSLGQALTFGFIVALAITGIIHFARTAFNDKIRIRMLYNCFILLTCVSAGFLLLRSEHYGLLMRILIIGTSPLIGHFVTLTRTRITNIAFCLIAAGALLLTGYNLWTSSSIFL